MRYSGKLGIVEQTEVRPGIWEETVTEVPVLGTTRQATATLDSADRILPDLGTTTSITVPARGVGPVDNSNIRYITHKGSRWQIRSIVDEPPRIVIYIGEKYNGPTPE
jgi:hypothetical protein